ncbi:MAG TPA: DUF4389 domain-containing protein [Frankiaceae bacterium]|nr:DUF4389 domain-containing protein [Frankiaceae bacterium]
MSASYPLHVEAHLDAPLSRWRWLVKWLLAIPHYVVLAFLWLAFTMLSAVALVAIVATGRYPRPIFDFNVGVLRWTWRVQYYAYGALGTDRYPPFTLDDVPDYPARLDVDYPEHLSRGLALVKWWLLAIPHYLVVGVLVGGGWFLAQTDWFGGGLIGLLVLVAGVALAFTGRYPEQLFDLVLGLNRWVLRVVAYAGLMTDEYPPFRLDSGGADPGGTITVPPAGPPPSPPESRWGAGRIVAVVAGALLLMTSAGLVTAGSAALWADRAGRDSAGYLTSDDERFTTGTYAVVSDAVELHGGRVPRALFDRVRVRVRASEGRPVFVGIARTRDVDAYLSGVARLTVGDGASTRRTTDGGAPDGTPATRSFWTVSASGQGTQTVVWPVEDGTWTVVAMNQDGSRAVDVRADVGVRAPDLGTVAAGLLLAGLVVFASGAAIVVVAARTAR